MTMLRAACPLRVTVDNFGSQTRTFLGPGDTDNHHTGEFAVDSESAGVYDRRPVARLATACILLWLSASCLYSNLIFTKNKPLFCLIKQGLYSLTGLPEPLTRVFSKPTRCPNRGALLALPSG